MFRFSVIPLELAIMTASEYLPETEPRPLPRDRYEKASFATSEIEMSGTTVDEVYDDRYLVVSPYTEKDHLLDLETLDTENQLLALSLTSLACLRDDYATAHYVDIFNWGDVIEGLRALARQRNHVWREASFFVVAFRSQIPPTTVYADLGALDKAAHIEATASGGFLKYVARGDFCAMAAPRSRSQQVLVRFSRLGRPKPGDMNMAIAGGCETGWCWPGPSQGSWGC
jgi:hypothetical protein